MQQQTISRVKELEELINNGQFSEAENVWIEAAAGGIEDVTPFLNLAQRMAKAQQGQKASTLLEMLVEPLVSADQAEAACSVVKRAAEIDPNNRNLKTTALKAFGARFSGIDGFETVVKDAEDSLGNDPGRYVNTLHQLCSFRVGDYLYHDAGWGLGKVVALDLKNKRLLVDFDDAKGHEVELEAATNFFRKLPASHFLARKASDVANLKREALESPANLIRCVLRSLEGKVTLRRVKDLLVPDVIAKGAWSKWWTDTKKELTERGIVRVGTGNNPPLSLLHIPTTVEDEYAERLASCHTSAAFALSMRKYFEDSKPSAERAPFLKRQMGVLFDRLNKREHLHDGEKILAKFLLDDVKDFQDGVDLDYALDVRAIAADTKRILASLEAISIADFQQRALNLVKEVNPGWQEAYAEALLVSVPACWDDIASELRDAGENEKLFASTRKIYDNGERYPEQLMWAVRYVIVEGAPSDLGLDVNRAQALVELLRLGTHIYHTMEKAGRKNRALLLKFRATLAERNNRLARVVLEEAEVDQARHILHNVRLNPSLSEAHVENLEEIILGRFPELTTEEKAVVIDDEDQGELLTTITGYRRKRRELDEILNVELPTVQKAIGEALALGDISENAELEAARAKEEVLRAQVGRLNTDLERARIVKPVEIKPDVAGFGTIVTVKNTDSGKVDTYTLLGRWDADSEHQVISDISAIGKGITGLRVGESRSFKTPDGATVTLEVTAIKLAEFEAE